MTEDLHIQEMNLWQEQLDFETAEAAKQEIKPKDNGFHICDTETAQWVVGKIADVDNRLDILASQYEAMKKSLENDKRFFDWRFGDELRAWTQGNLPAKKKSIKLLTGTVGFRTIQGGIEIVEAERVMEWARKNCPEAIRVEERLVKTPITEQFEKTGELPDGCIIREGGEKFYIKTK